MDLLIQTKIKVLMVDKVASKLINMSECLADEYKNLILATFHLKLIKTLRVSRHFYIISIESNFIFVCRR